MFIVISMTSPDPMHKQVKDQIVNAIAGGNLKPHEQLPSIRQMAAELKISPITIKRSYADMESEGYIYARQGLGSFVCEVNRDKLRVEKLAEIRKEVERIIKEGEKYGISTGEIIAAIRDREGETGGKNR
ncbi:MAG: GntR family transcriptional regulator [Actinomycetia bacterium]|nr:GntR family transcriptional regulator [Actinomycetes bacterium]